MEKNTKVLDKKVVAVNMVPKPSHHYITLTTKLQHHLAQYHLKPS